MDDPFVLDGVLSSDSSSDCEDQKWAAIANIMVEVCTSNIGSLFSPCCEH